MPLILLYVVSSATSALVAWYCWLRHEVVGAREYAAVALSQSLWTLGYIFELTSADLAGKIFWDNAQFVTTATWIGAFLAFALRYTERPLPRPRVTAPLLAAPLLALVLLAYTDPWHGLIRANSRLVPGNFSDALLYDVTGPVWALALYAYGAYLGCVLMLLLNPARTHPLYRRQIGLLVVGSLVPIAGSVLSLTFLADAPSRDISPFTFVISSILVAWALFRFRLFDLVPIARDVVVESIADAVFVLDADGRLIDLNPAARALIDATTLGVNRLPADLLPDAWRRHVARARAGNRYEVQELELPTRAGARQVELRLQPVYSRRGAYRGCVAVVRDITERKAVEAELYTYRERLEALVEARTADLRAANELLQREMTRRRQLEAQIIKGQRLEALGRMASGIAHDFNNVLAVVRGAADLLATRRAHAEQDRADLAAIAQATTQAATLTRQLLAFSRGQSFELAPVDLALAVGEFADILRRLAGEQVELLLELQPGNATILADVGQLQQVLVNLVINARDAMPAGGQLAVGVSRVTIRASDDASAARWGESVRLTVADSGTGMDELTRQRLFEPFFTTKEPGRGTGLGLPVVYGIITQLGGAIQVESAPGRGTTFTIDLPPLEFSLLWAAPGQEPRLEHSLQSGPQRPEGELQIDGL
jgi:PAS domain S-box-containing protein